MGSCVRSVQMINGWEELKNLSNNPLIPIRNIEDARRALVQGYSVTCGTQAVTLEMLKCAEDNKIDLPTAMKIMGTSDSQ
mgnify:CR=1 FL=1